MEADESLLRQVLFNLFLNAIQAVDNGGVVKVILSSISAREAAIEVHDNGPGVPLESREEIFRPYFTTRKDGTGFGLAVVRQIVLAHHWEIEYLPGGEKGSTFRITGLKLV
ncbi:MAG: ATP-binding protein [Promethearchaeota archaeon]